MTVKKAAMEYDYPLYRPPSEAYSINNAGQKNG